MSAAGRADNRPSRSHRRSVLLRARRAQRQRRRRLGRCVEAPSLCLGVQGQTQGPGRGLQSAPAIRAGAGEPAAADRLGHGSVPHPHQLTNTVSETHEFELDDLTDAATRDKLKWALSDPERLRPGESRQSLTERAAASSLRWRRACGNAARTRRRSRTSSTDLSSACSPKMWACCPIKCSHGCWKRHTSGPKSSSRWPGTCSGQWPQVGLSASSPWHGSMVDCLISLGLAAGEKRDQNDAQRRGTRLVRD